MELIKFHEDKRGCIYRLLYDGRFINILETKAGYYRAGDFHPHNQFDLVIKGQVAITKAVMPNDEIKILKENESITIDKHVPHLFYSITDSIVIEWWDGPFEAKFYQRFRYIVENQK